ncbi:MAG: flagellar export chaperone FliS [Candidatus Omnitrophota bacterium]
MLEGNVYLKSNLEGMTNDELILYIYQEMLRILNQTLFYFEKNDIENRVSGINKAIEVLHSLMSILNFEAGGEIAVRLRSLYLYSIKKLTAANFDRDPKPVDEVIRIFRELYSGWAQKIENDKKSNAVRSPLSVSVNGPEVQSLKGLEIYG